MGIYPIPIFLSTMVALIALAKLSVSTWGRSFDPPRKPWAIILIVDSLVKVCAALVLAGEIYYQVSQFPDSRNPDQPPVYVYLQLALIIIRIVFLGFVFVINSLSNFILARAHLQQDSVDFNKEYQAEELDDDIF